VSGASHLFVHQVLDVLFFCPSQRLLVQVLVLRMGSLVLIVCLPQLRATRTGFDQLSDALSDSSGSNSGSSGCRPGHAFEHRVSHLKRCDRSEKQDDEIVACRLKLFGLSGVGGIQLLQPGATAIDQLVVFVVVVVVVNGDQLAINFEHRACPPSLCG
jgi:hypothetical protein